MKDDLTLEDLSTYSGLTLRTLRYYIQEGILQGPDSRGKYARYSQEHLDRIELIRRLKELRLPLQEIGQIIENMTPEEISKVREYQDILKTKIKRPEFPKTSELSFSNNKSSALEYIRELESRFDNVQEIANAPARKIHSVVSNANLIPSIPVEKHDYRINTPKEEWTRFVIKDGVELNIKRTIGTDNEVRIGILVEYAKRLFSDR